MKLLKEADYTEYLIVKLSKYVKISMQTFSDTCLQDSLQNEKGPGTSLNVTSLVYFFNKIFLLECYINWPNLITTQCLLPKSFRLMYFLFHV